MTTARKVDQDTCRHYWLLPDSGAAEVKGVCKLCGAERDHNNQWGFYKSARDAIRDWEVQEHIKRVTRNEEVTGRGITPL